MGYRHAIQLGQRSAFIRRDLDLRAEQKGAVLDVFRPGKPTDNGFIEPFDGEFRAECRHAHWCMSLDHARAKTEAWRRDYNEVHPRSAIGNKPPIELTKGSEADVSA